MGFDPPDTPVAAKARLRTPWRSRRSLALLLGLAISLVAGSWFLYPDMAAAYHRWQATRALARFDLATALARLESSRALRPGDVRTQLLLAQTARRLDDFETAREALARAEDMGGESPEVRLEQLLLQAQSGMVRPVEGLLQLHLADGSGDAQLILEALARGALTCNLVERSYGYAELWTRRYPDSWQAHYWMGRALERGLRHDLAAEAYQQALERQPGHLEAHLRRGQVLLQRGRYRDALPNLETYAQSRPDEPAALIALARCQQALCPAEEVRGTLDRLLSLPGEHPEGWVLMGQLELSADRPEDALRWFRKAARALPNDLELNVALATSLRRLRQDEEAKAYERRHQEIRRDLREMDRLTKAILTRPGDAALRHEAGVTLLRLGQDDQAVRWFVSALQIDPTHRPTREALARCIRRLNDPRLEALWRPFLEGATGPP